MMIVAHRGAGHLAPENSWTAFQTGAQLGVDALECDVHLSRDGHLMVCHDASLERTTGRPGWIRDASRAELEDLDVGDGAGLPALEALLTRVGARFRVELKHPNTVAPLIDLMRRHPEWTTRVMVSSFHHLALQTVTAALPQVQAVAILNGYPVEPGRVAAQAGARYLSLQHQGLFPDYVDRCRREGVGVTVWNPTRPDDIVRLVGLGVDGITSDRPDLVLAAVRPDSPTSPS